MIYTLSKDGIPFYVGKTNSFAGRMRVHKNRGIYSDEAEVIDEDDSTEQYWVQQLQTWGFKIKNQYYSLVGYKTPNEKKKKLSDSAKRDWDKRLNR